MEEDFFNQKIFDINWNQRIPYEIIHKFTNEPVGKNGAGIIIDNGSYQCRAGWSVFEKPNIIFKNLVGILKTSSKSNSVIVGNRLLSIEPGKLHKKTPFDKNIITHFSTMEHIFDHIFSSLNIKDSAVDHDIVLTEPLFNINWSRKNMTEMLFELYGAKSVNYGVDFLFAFNKFNTINEKTNCLIISSSYHTTHIVPIINGEIQTEKVRRINVGGYHHNELLTRSLGLKYPEFKAKITPDIIELIQENYTVCARNYKEQLWLLEAVYAKEHRRIMDEQRKRIYGSLEMYRKAHPEVLEAELQDKRLAGLKSYRNIIEYENSLNLNEEESHKRDLIHDLYFINWPNSGTDIVLTEEELRRKQEQRREQSRRLRELMQKKREENLRNLEKELKELEELLYLRDTDKFQFEELLLSKGFANVDQLTKRINKISNKINYNHEAKEEEETIDEEKRWPLIHIPDEDLVPDQIKVINFFKKKLKKIQKMQRNAYLSRLEKREALKREKEKIEEVKQKDPEGYLVSLYKRKRELLEKLENYKVLRKEMTNRHSKVNQKRMMVLAELGKEAEKSKRTASNKDEFGLKDEDWDVYRGIQRHNLSEDEEEDMQQLNEVEAQIIELDPNYLKYNDNISQNFMFADQLFLGVDQFRGFELIFQPHIIGIDQSGLIETIVSIMKTFSLEEQRAICSNIFLTGGNMNAKYIEERIYKELRKNVHCDIPINVVKSDDCSLDSWFGAREFYNQNALIGVSRQEYLEKGYDCLNEHYCSNPYPYNIHSEKGSKRKF